MKTMLAVSAAAVLSGVMALQMPTTGFSRALDEEATMTCGTGPGAECKKTETTECVEWKMVTLSGNAGVTGGGVSGTLVCAREVKTTLTYYWTSGSSSVTGKVGATI